MQNIIEEKIFSEEGRRFKVEKIEKYYKKISEEDEKIQKRTAGLILTAVMAIEFFINSNRIDSSIVNLICVSLGVVDVNLFLKLLKKMIASIARKTIYEVKIDELSDEINEYDSVKRGR